MLSQTSLVALFSLLTLSSAIPTPVELAPRCGQTILPTFLQQLTESSPGTVQPNTLSTGGDFHVSQSAGATNRIYQIAAFENIPAGAYACTLGLTLPSNVPLTITGTPTLNVTTIFTNSPSSISYPNTWTWDSFFNPGGAQYGNLGQGLFGTITPTSGVQGATINSEGCPVGGGNVAFLFDFASWVGGDASVEFNEYWNAMNGAGLAGVYLTHSC